MSLIAMRPTNGPDPHDVPVVALAPDAAIVDGPSGEVVWGGSPFRLQRLDPAAKAVLDTVASTPPANWSDAEAALARRLLIDGVLERRVADHAAAPPLDPGTVDVVVPCRDHGPLLPRLVERLADIGPATITIVDDGSGAPLPHLGDSVRVVRHTTALGPGAARNRGAAEGTAAWLLFVDADIELLDGWWPPLASAATSWPHPAGVAPRVLGADRGDRPAIVRPRSRVPFTPGAALLVQRSAFDEVGGFATDLVGGEDVDLVWRLIDDGHLVAYEPASVVRHPEQATLRARLRQQVSYGASQAALAVRHPAKVRSTEMSPWSVAIWALALGSPRARMASAALWAVSAARFAVELRTWSRTPVADAIRLAGGGTIRAGAPLAETTRRIWWPLLAAGSLAWRPPRRWLAASLVAGARHPARLLDELAMGAGSLLGAWRSRSVNAYRPASITSDDLLGPASGSSLRS